MLPYYDDRLVDLMWSREDFLFDNPSFVIEQHCTIATFLQNILIDTFTRFTAISLAKNADQSRTAFKVRGVPLSGLWRGAEHP